jgi:cell division protein FtsB
MLVKKNTCGVPRAATVMSMPSLTKQLEELHARRSAIKRLIAALEDYQRFHARRADTRERKTA